MKLQGGPYDGKELPETDKKSVLIKVGNSYSYAAYVRKGDVFEWDGGYLQDDLSWQEIDTALKEAQLSCSSS